MVYLFLKIACFIKGKCLVNLIVRTQWLYTHLLTLYKLGLVAQINVIDDYNTMEHILDSLLSQYIDVIYLKWLKETGSKNPKLLE